MSAWVGRDELTLRKESLDCAKLLKYSVTGATLPSSLLTVDLNFSIHPVNLSQPATYRFVCNQHKSIRVEFLISNLGSDIKSLQAKLQLFFSFL